jgi:hypothetical protein
MLNSDQPYFSHESEAVPHVDEESRHYDEDLFVGKKHQFGVRLLRGLMQAVFIDVGVQLLLKGEVPHEGKVLSETDREGEEVNKIRNLGMLALATVHSEGKSSLRERLVISWMDSEGVLELELDSPDKLRVGMILRYDMLEIICRFHTNTLL